MFWRTSSLAASPRGSPDWNVGHPLDGLAASRDEPAPGSSARYREQPELKKTRLKPLFLILAPRTGLEPVTSKLTASCSTIELPGNVRLIIHLVFRNSKGKRRLEVDIL